MYKVNIEYPLKLTNDEISKQTKVDQDENESTIQKQATNEKIQSELQTTISKEVIHIQKPKKRQQCPLMLSVIKQQTLHEYLKDEKSKISLLPMEVNIDEVSKGSLILSLCTCAYILPRDYESLQTCQSLLSQVKDSKKLSEKKRLEIVEQLKAIAYAYVIDFAEIDEIDTKNILNANMSSFHRCIDKIRNKLKEEGKEEEIDLLVIDGNQFVPYFYTFENENKQIQRKDLKYTTIKSADALYIGVACASIIAKVTRDQLVYEICEKYPIYAEKYGWKKNHGYGTKQHIDVLKKEQTFTEFHRKSFNPVKSILVNRK